VIFRDAFLQFGHVIIILCVLRSPRSAIQSLLGRRGCRAGAGQARLSEILQAVITEVQATECLALFSWRLCKTGIIGEVMIGGRDGSIAKD